MAFLFLQDGSVVTGRINWSEYWKMQQDMANLIGCHRDILVALFHVEHPPRDIEEMDAQVVLPVRALRDAAKDILQELAGHAREDEDDPSMMQRPPFLRADTYLACLCLGKGLHGGSIGRRNQ